jgi:hypothetical protein
LWLARQSRRFGFVVARPCYKAANRVS